MVLLAALGDGDLALPGEERPGDRALRPLHLRGGALGDDLAAVLAGARAHVDEPVGAAHHLLVVLDDDDRVPEVAQPLERVDQLVVVALVQADRGLVEDVEDADELAPDLGREAEPLRLAAGQGRRGAVEVEVADADVVEEGQALADLLEDAVADQVLGRRQVERVHELERARDGQARELVDVELADGDGQHLRLQARALADGARAEAHVLLDPLPLRGRVGLAVAALEARDDPLEREHVRAPAAHAVAVGDVDALAVGAVEEPVLLLLGQLAPGRVEVDLVALGDGLDDGLVVARVADRPRDERPLADRERRVRDEQVRVDLLLRPEAGAARARAVRAVEGEDPRLQLRERDAVLGAGEVLREEQLLAVDHVDHDEAVGEAGRGLDRLGEARPEVRLHHEPVDDDVDRVLELLVERDLLLEQALLAVHLHAREALAAKLLEQVAELALAVAHDRRVHREARPLRELQDLVDDRLEALARDRAAADRAVRPADARVEEAEIVVDLGDRADGRARVAARGLLVDRDGRAEAVDVVDVRLLHHLQELARVGRERLDVAALALGVDRVEGQARLARTRTGR